MMSIRSRVGQMARQVGPPPGPRRRFVMIEPGDGPAIVEGRYMLSLRVPRSAWSDPEDALTDEQRSLIRPGDRRIIIGRTCEPDPDQDPAI
jgi:hypothetical protein